MVRSEWVKNGGGSIVNNYNITQNMSSFDIGVGNNGTIGIGSDLSITNGYFENPNFATGVFSNFLLQSEVMGTTWVVTNASVGTANAILGPTHQLLAERITPTGTNTLLSHLEQTITNNTPNKNWTFSIWLKTPNATNYVDLRIDTNTTNGTPKRVYLTNNWKRYYVSQYINDNHRNISVNVFMYNTTIDAWGGQLEWDTTTMRNYGYPTTTIGYYSLQPIVILRVSSYILGSLNVIGLSVGGALTTATTIANSGTQTTTYASTLNTLSLYGHVFTSSASTSAIPVQGAPLLSFRTTIWNNTATTNQEYNFGTTGDNLTKETSLILFNKNDKGINTTIMNITQAINSTYARIKIDADIILNNNHTFKLYANDNNTQLMCLNVSQSGTITAYRC